MSEPFVFVSMGTVVSLHAGHTLPREVQDAVLTAFVELEERFSIHQPETEGARVARRELEVRHASAEFRAVYGAAVYWRTLTEGAFTPHRPDGVVDLGGLVKALAVQAAGRVLAHHGVHDWCLNAGGDVLTSGVRPDGRAWVIGVVDPDDRTNLLSQVAAGPGRRAVATSGTAERGEHVWRLGADGRFRQVTVVAGDIVTADVLATAILAGGPDTLQRAHEVAGIEVLACTAAGEFWASGAFRTSSAA